MKMIRLSSPVGILAAALLFSMLAADAAPKSPAKAAAKPTADSAATNIVVEIPISTFVIPSNSKEGRDPFFPDSTRVYSADAPKSAHTNAPIALKLNGLSGTAEKRLAIINGYTFAEGEEAEVQTSTGRQQVRCISIKDDGVEIMVSGQHRELKLREGL